MAETYGSGLCLCQQDAYMRSLTTTVLRCSPAEAPPQPQPSTATKRSGKSNGKTSKAAGATATGAAAGASDAPAPAANGAGANAAEPAKPPPPCRYEVYLKDSPMFPESGGQPCDQGQLVVISTEGVPGAEPVINVVEVVWKEGVLCHVTDAPLEPGTQVEVRVDWQRRYDHMQQHTGQHVFSAVADLLLGADTASWELHPLDAETHGSGDYGCVAVDLTVPQISTEQLLKLEERANEELRALRLVSPLVLDPRVAADMDRMEQLRSDPTFRGQLPPPDKIKGGKLRLIHVEGLDINACGGTHVRCTGEVQVVKVVGAERTRGTTRVRLMAGGRALAALSGCLAREAALTARLTCPPARHAEVADMLLRDRREGAKARKLLAAELAIHLGKALALGLGGTGEGRGQQWALLHRPSSDLDLLSLVAAAALEAGPGLQLLLLTTDNLETGSAPPATKPGVEDSVEVTFLLAGQPDLVRASGPRVAEALGGRGGGRPGR